MFVLPGSNSLKTRVMNLQSPIPISPSLAGGGNFAELKILLFKVFHRFISLDSELTQRSPMFPVTLLAAELGAIFNWIITKFIIFVFKLHPSAVDISRQSFSYFILFYFLVDKAWKGEWQELRDGKRWLCQSFWLGCSVELLPGRFCSWEVFPWQSLLSFTGATAISSKFIMLGRVPPIKPDYKCLQRALKDRTPGFTFCHIPVCGPVMHREICT